MESSLQRSKGCAMVDYAKFKTKLEERIKLKQEPIERVTSTCSHDWVRYRQTVPIERTDRQPPFLGFRAYFVVKACPKCETKVVTDYIVER